MAVSIEPLVFRVGPFLGMTAVLSGAGGEESNFLRAGRFDVVTRASSSFCGGGDDGARFFPVLGLPLGFFTTGTGAVSDSFAGGGGSLVFSVFCLFEPRVNRKSPSCSSYTAAAVDVGSNCQSPLIPRIHMFVLYTPARRLLFRRDSD